MFSGFYNTGIDAFQTLLRIAASFNPKARQWVDGRHRWADKLTKQLNGNECPIAWFHAASLGEFEQGRPVIEAYRLAYPAHKILLTFFHHRVMKYVKIMPGLIISCIYPPTRPPMPGNLYRW